MTGAVAQWIRVSKRKPCPICGKGDWCGVSADGEVAHCMRVESSRQTSAGGWIHRIADGKPRTHTNAREQARAPNQTADFQELMTRYQMYTAPGDVRRLAAGLGVTADSLRRLDVAWAGPRRAWAFPMRDTEGQVIGIRLRNEDGAKWAVPGSRQGLFMPDGAIGDQCDCVMVCEGPTDTAAMLDLDYYAIGRPSCRGNEDELVELLFRRDVVILADRDQPKQRPDGSTWRPGQEGAEHLARRLHNKARSVKVVKPLTGKDARAWKQAGATRQIVDAVINNACFWRPQSG